MPLILAPPVQAKAESSVGQPNRVFTRVLYWVKFVCNCEVRMIGSTPASIKGAMATGPAMVMRYSKLPFRLRSPPGVRIVPHLDRSNLLHYTTHTVLHNLTEGIVLVAVILSKLVIAGVIVLGIGVLTHSGTQDRFEGLLVGAGMLALAAFSPIALLRVLPLFEEVLSVRGTLTAGRAAQRLSYAAAGGRAMPAPRRMWKLQIWRAHCMPWRAVLSSVARRGKNL